MSTMAGVYSRNGVPVERDLLRQVGLALRQTGPDDIRFASCDAIGMAHFPFYTDWESRRLQQPVVTADGFVLVFDGRLDNPEEVGRSLAENTAVALPDVELVLSAYRRWGYEGFGRLVGDFTVALWDPRRNCLLLCRDALGRRPLYYHLTSEHVVWASACRPLLHALDLPVRLDDEYVADLLTNRPPEGSPFKGIGAVPGGHALIVHRADAHLRRYWAFDPGNRICYRADEDYEDHFRELFQEAVRCRLRADGPVFCELSGGIDSSSIVCAVDRLTSSVNDVKAPSFHTVSYVFNRSSGSDERRYIRLVEERVGRPGVHISEEECPILEPLPDSFAPDLPTNQLCYLARQDRLAREMERCGSCVLLSGIGGDQLFLSEIPDALPLADFLVQLRLGHLLRECREWSRWLKLPYVKTLWLGAFRPLLPPRLRTFMDRKPVGEWLDPAFVKRMNLAERAQGMPDDLGFELPIGSIQYGLIRQTMRAYALERCLSRGHVDVRYPYLDRRLVEFALAIPVDQKLRLGETRSLVRRAFRGILPEAIRQRKTKAGPTEAFLRALSRARPWLSSLLSDPRVAAYGFVDPKIFASALERARHGVVSHPARLIRTISLELWLQTLDVDPRQGAGADSRPCMRSPNVSRASGKSRVHRAAVAL